MDLNHSLEKLALACMAPIDAAAKLIPYELKKRLGFRDRAAEAEVQLRDVFERWETGDREHRVQLQGKAMAALSYLPSARLLELVRATRFDWLKARAVEVLTRRALTLAQVIELWKAVGDYKPNQELVAAQAARALIGEKPPKDFPLDLLDAAADAGALGRNEALEALLERRPPDLERALWFFHRGDKSARLLSHIRSELPKADFQLLVQVSPGLDDGSPLSGDFRAALAASAASLSPQHLAAAARSYPEFCEVLVAEVVGRLGHMSSPLGRAPAVKKDRPRRGDAEDLRELAERLLSHAKLEEAEDLIDEILELELRRSRAGLPPVCDKAVAAMIQRYPTGVIGAQAAKALGLIGTRSSIEVLLEAASSLDENIRQRALEAISAINARGTKRAAR